MSITKSTNLIVPEVLEEAVKFELQKKIKLTPLATVDTTLVGQPGDRIKVPAWDYIGDATDLTEGGIIDVTQMSTTSKTMTIKQIGKGVEITDYALAVSFDDALGGAVEQIAQAHASKIDEDMLTALRTATLTVDIGRELNVEKLEEAIAKFDDEDKSEMVLLVNPKNSLTLFRDAREKLLYTDVGADALISGAVGKVLNATIVRSRRLADNEAFLVKVGALRLIKKRDLNLEHQRDILKKSTVITADTIYGTYLFDAKKAVKISMTA